MRIAWIFAAAALAPVLCAEPARAADWSGEAGLVSDYRYRGLSLSDRKPAFQASLAVDTEAGFHGELWTSTIKGGGTGNIEVDASAGYTASLSETVTLDCSATYYAYPGDWSANALEFTTALEASQGPLTASLQASVAPAQDGVRDERGKKATNVYALAGLGYALAPMPLTLRASAGYERGAWDMTDDGGKWDWTLGADLEFQHARVSLEGIGSNAGDETVVASLFLAF